MQRPPQVEIVSAGPGWAFSSAGPPHTSSFNQKTGAVAIHPPPMLQIKKPRSSERVRYSFKATQLRNGGLEPRQCAAKSLIFLLSPVSGFYCAWISCREAGCLKADREQKNSKGTTPVCLSP